MKTLPEDTVPIQRAWLESLYALSERVRKDQEKWYLTEKSLMPESVSMLIGYASSSKTFLNLIPKK